MGGTYWSDEHYRQRAEHLRRAGRSTFEYHEALSRLPQHQRRVHEKMDPFGVKWRESRDSEAHPESRAVAVLFDVTGSMGCVPRILQQNLCQLMNLLLDKGYLAHPQILIGGIGDATCDRAPLQVGQFESGIEIDEDLAKLWLEGGGGGQMNESYELAMYFMARKTAIDCLEKHRQRGYLFLIGDEMPYRYVCRNQLAGLLGDRLEADIPVEEVIRELEAKYDTYFILPNLSSYYDNPTIHRCWTNLLGEKVIRLDDPQGISDLIAAVIGMTEGVVDRSRIVADLREAGRGSMAHVVSRALASMGQGEACRRRICPAAVDMDGPALPLRSAGKTAPHWDFGFTYKSRRWHFVMRIIRALARPIR
ncbi:MAG: hypothetical protein ACLP9L_38840 [Thermoguttaceae bacterium]